MDIKDYPEKTDNFNIGSYVIGKGFWAVGCQSI